MSERSELACEDSKVLEEMSHELKLLDFALDGCGRDGDIEYKKVCLLAPKVIKIVANYLEQAK